MARMIVVRIALHILLERPEGRYKIYEKIILKLVLRIYTVKLWAGFLFRIYSSE